jgi:hypothetical protein
MFACYMNIRTPPMMVSLGPRRTALDSPRWIEECQPSWHPCVVVGRQLSGAHREGVWEPKRASIALVPLSTTKAPIALAPFEANLHPLVGSVCGRHLVPYCLTRVSLLLVPLLGRRAHISHPPPPPLNKGTNEVGTI